MQNHAYRQHYADLPDKKSLYITSQVPVCMKSGNNHLILTRDNAHIQRYPVTRICRIICNQHVTWDGEALALCFNQGIPITWTDGHNQVLGHSQSSYTQPVLNTHRLVY